MMMLFAMAMFVGRCLGLGPWWTPPVPTASAIGRHSVSAEGGEDKAGWHQCLVDLAPRQISMTGWSDESIKVLLVGTCCVSEMLCDIDGA
jgi:hypothetical protein